MPLSEMRRRDPVSETTLYAIMKIFGLRSVTLNTARRERMVTTAAMEIVNPIPIAIKSIDRSPVPSMPMIIVNTRMIAAPEQGTIPVASAVKKIPPLIGEP